MAETILFTDVGEGIHEGKLVKWLIEEGQAIKEDQPLCEIETDKAVVEIPSSKTGTALKLHAKIGTTLHVGDPLVTIGKLGESTDSSVQPANNPEKIFENDRQAVEKTETPTFQPAHKTPKTDSRTLGRILANPLVRKLAAELGVDLFEVKGTGQNGLISEKDVREKAGQVSAGKPPAMAEKESQPPKITEARRNLAPPSVRKIAFELGVDLNQVSGSGPFGRISEEDVRNFGKIPQSGPSLQIMTGETSRNSQQAHEVRISIKAFGPEIRIPLNPVRKIISQRLSQSEKVPHVTHVDEADVTELWHLREREKAKALDKGVKLTLLPFVVKAVMKALVKFPTFNAALDEEKQEIVLRKYFHAGIATDTPEGLMVPVVKDADKKSVFQIAKEIQSLSELARQKHLKPDELSGSTFTITNIGSAGGIYATPLINPPEAAILGVMRMQLRPAYDKDGNVRPRNFLPLCLTFDHRINDGAKAAQFVAEICKHLENSESLLVGDI